MGSDKEYEAMVEKIVRTGKHGPYAVARTAELDGSVTFSLDSENWQEREWPEPGTCVMLSDVRKKRAGWRAHRARFVKPSDKPAPQHQKGA